MTAGLAKAPWTSTGRITPISSRAAAADSAATSERILPWIRTPTTTTRTASAAI